jgi:hypothetical protein
MLNGIFMLPWSWWGYARVSRFDIAVDLWGVEIADWVWDKPQRVSREAICRQRQVRTIYQGAKKGVSGSGPTHCGAMRGCAGRGTWTCPICQ